jgi:hypothetical protein
MNAMKKSTIWDVFAHVLGFLAFALLLGFVFLSIVLISQLIKGEDIDTSALVLDIGVGVGGLLFYFSSKYFVLLEEIESKRWRE